MKIIFVLYFAQLNYYTQLETASIKENDNPKIGWYSFAWSSR